jgi:CubicO group peptidase (beta-lactamase class C family)
MKNTFHEPKISGKQFARGYINFALSDPEYTAPESKGWISAAGAMYSTPSDMEKWDLALMGGKVLKPESYDLMTKPRTLKDGRLSDYGCGIGTRMQNGRPILTHGGAVSGFTCSSMMVPSTKSALIVMCNQDSGLGNLPGQLFALLLKEAVPNVPKIKGDPAAATARKVFAKLQKGQVDRKEFGEEFNIFLTDEKVAGAAKRLQKFGPVKDAEVLSSNERGGMEVTTTRLTFEKGALKILMYRMPNGVIEQYFVNPD